MENKVRALDELTIRKIAAGEVVERPASVVKELMENAVDAGATKVTLEISGGGRTLIRINDNGTGMNLADAKLALERHTTSKITSSTDLDSLHTFGFRGEALPSISAVSRLTLLTRESAMDHGIKLKLEGSKLLEETEQGCAVGTTIEVEDLFFNTPARLKFLKTESTERGKIVNTFEEIALAHPHIAFQFKSEDRTLADTPSRKNPADRMADLWGEEFNLQNLVALNHEHPWLNLTGFTSQPGFHQPTKATQILYVNQRPIFSRSITHALYEAYRDCLPVGRHPAALLFIRVNPDLIDVNVHPSKREVRFQYESQIYEAVIKEIRLKRGETSLPQKINLPSAENAPNVPWKPRLPDSYPAAPAFNFNAKRTLEAPIALNNIPVQAANPVDQPRVMGQFNALYIVYEHGSSLVIVDQHAAGERIMYEKFRKALLDKDTLPTQKLLLPLLWNVSLAQAEQLNAALPILNKLGFELELFGDKTFRISECPALIREKDLKEVLDTILNAFDNDSKPTLAIEDKIMHAACRAAIKANDSLSSQEMEQLLKDLKLCENPHTCPHGRPTTLTLTRPELDKKFGRT